MAEKVNYIPGKDDAENFEKTVCIETHENVTVEYEIAGIGSRCLASFVDKVIRVAVYVISLIIAVILIYNNYSLEEIEETIAASFRDILYLVMAVYLGLMLLSVIYHTVAELVSGGSSPGKKLIGIRVVQVTGEAATPVQIVIRNLLRLIDQVPGGSLIDGIIALYNPQGRRVGDLAAGTMVIKYRKGLDLSSIIEAAEQQERKADEEEEEAVYVPPQVEILTDAELDAAPAFFSKDETAMLSKYLDNRNKYLNRAIYDQRFAELIAERRGYEKKSGFTEKEALQIIRAAHAYMTNYRFVKPRQTGENRGDAE